jgi:hypothetical protein
MMRVALTAAFVVAALVAPLAPWTVGPLDLPHPRGYVAYHTNAHVTIDGKLDDKAWRSAAWTDTFVDIEGDTKAKPRFDTRVKMLWDDKFLYVGAELREPHVWATLTEHDSVIFHDPDFEVFIDPDGDNHRYYEFEINARGTYWDLFLPKPYKDGGKPDNGWEIPGLKSAVAVDGTINDARDTDRAWTVELAFPWSVLGANAHVWPPRENDQWRINFSRVEWPVETTEGHYQKPAGAKEDNWVWSPQYVVNMHRPETWGYVQFSRQKPASAQFNPDITWPARRWLMQVYYAQVAFKKANGRYAASLAELHMDVSAEPVLRNPALMVDGDQFRASVEIKNGDFPITMSVRQDSQLVLERRALSVGNAPALSSVR